MFYVKWGVRLVLLLLVAAFLHYTLPQHDIARINDTYEKRIDFGVNSIFWASGGSGNASGTVNRDVFFIQAFRNDGEPMVYRNEDTGWGWPPYFKFDTANLQAEASNLISKKDEETAQWVAIRHYGWRSELFSIFPNAVEVWPVAGPDVGIIPWRNIVILVVLFATYWAIRVRVLRFWRRRVAPMFDGDT